MSAIEPLSGKPQFRRVYATGRRTTRDGVTAIVRLRDDGPPRLGLAVGRAAGQAVVRNKIRRRLRHAFRAYGPAPADVILIGRAPLYSAPYSRVEEYVNSCLASAGLPGGAS